MTIKTQIEHYSSLFSRVTYSPESFEDRLKKTITIATGINYRLFNSRTRKREIVQAKQLFHTFTSLKTIN